jgi:AcrR family transcriptional regulator
MENRKFFLQKLTALFWKHGSKTLTMDDIAKEFSVSKKTLYQRYENKEEILKEVLNFILNETIAQIEKSKKHYKNPIEILLNSHSDMETFMTRNDNIFILQMGKYYSEILDEHKKRIFSELIDFFSDNIRQGREMELYKKEFDEKMYFKYLLQLFFSTEDSPIFEEERENRRILCIGILDFYLNSILTEKGLNNYNELKKKYEELA